MASQPTILCCPNIRIISPPLHPPTLPVSPFDILFDQAGSPPQIYIPQLPFSPSNYYHGVLLVEYTSVIADHPPTGGHNWYAALRLPDDTPAPGRLVEIPFGVPERAQAAGLIESTEEGQNFYTCALGNCPNHADLTFVATWVNFITGGGGGQEQDVGEDDNGDDGGEDSDEMYKDLRARVKNGRGVPCDECSKNRRACSRKLNPGGPPKCEVCAARGVECTWDTVGSKGGRGGRG
jgi:hypothetical protein